jgi:hypothetical protein
MLAQANATKTAVTTLTTLDKTGEDNQWRKNTLDVYLVVNAKEPMEITTTAPIAALTNTSVT